MKVGSVGGSESISGELWSEGGNRAKGGSQAGAQNSVEQYAPQQGGGSAASGEAQAPDLLGVATAALMGLLTRTTTSKPGDDAQAQQMNLVLSFVTGIAAQLLQKEDLAAAATEYVQQQAAGGGLWVNESGSFDHSVGVSHQDSGRVEGDLGVAEGGYRVATEARTRGKGTAQSGPTGAEFSGDVYAGVSARAKAGGRVESVPLVSVGGYDVKAFAGGEAIAEAGAYAYAEGEAVVSYVPPEAAVSAEVGAFAGARVGVSAETGVGPAKVTGRAEAWAGAGATGKVDAGYHDGKLTFDYGAGVAWGVGAGYSGAAEVNLGEVTQAVAGVMGPEFAAALEQLIVAGALSAADAIDGKPSPSAKGAPAPGAPNGAADAAPPTPAIAQASTPPVVQGQGEDEWSDEEEEVRQS